MLMRMSGDMRELFTRSDRQEADDEMELQMLDKRTSLRAQALVDRGAGSELSLPSPRVGGRRSLVDMRERSEPLPVRSMSVVARSYMLTPKEMVANAEPRSSHALVSKRL